MTTKKTKATVNGLKLVQHDGVTEYSVCGKCGTTIDWSNFDPNSEHDDDTTCPHCGHADTAWQYAQK